ncbi:MAG: hypothetical protein R3C61_04160 [Bacteroidia bacterium]
MWFLFRTIAVLPVDSVQVTVRATGTAIEAEHVISRNFRVYPNPATDHITIGELRQCRAGLPMYGCCMVLRGI